MTDCSRWLSGATPPEPGTPQNLPHPGGVPAPSDGPDLQDSLPLRASVSLETAVEPMVGRVPSRGDGDAACPVRRVRGPGLHLQESNAGPVRHATHAASPATDAMSHKTTTNPSTHPHAPSHFAPWRLRVTHPGFFMQRRQDEKGLGSSASPLPVPSPQGNAGSAAVPGRIPSFPVIPTGCQPVTGG